MIERAIYEALVADSELTSYLSTYNGAPAVFSEQAPEDVSEPYVTFTITRSAVDSMIHEFNLYVDVWDYNQARSTSRAKARAAAMRIEFQLDNAMLDTEEYAGIRCRFFSGSAIQESDPQAVHYNTQFTIRAARKAWMAQL